MGLMKNKKGQFAGIILIILFLIIITCWFYYSNPYNTFMRDCKKINKDRFPCTGLWNLGQNSSICNNEIWQNQTHELDKYCQDKYAGNKNE